MTVVRDVMTKNVISFSPDASVYDCAKILREKRISGAPVRDKNGRVVGVLSEGDIMQLIEKRDLDINLILPSPLDVLELPVKMKLALDSVAKDIQKTATAKIEDIMTKDVVSISPGVDISNAAKTMSTEKVNRLPVIDKNKRLVGIITRWDIIGAI
jgi:CBS domain-containing protein